MSHTPGPWRVEIDSRTDCRIVVGASGYRIATPHEGVAEFNGYDADLVAAAPELLEALESMISSWDGPADVEKMDLAIQSARSAIAKAKGLKP